MQKFLHIHANYLADRVLTLGSTAPKVANGVNDSRANDCFFKKGYKNHHEHVPLRLEKNASPSQGPHTLCAACRCRRLCRRC